MFLFELRKRWLFFLGLTLFILAKIHHLNYGFYWDESSVYGPALQLMFKHGPSLLPNAISVEFSRGHPLFFLASGAAWMDIFGGSNISMHSFALFVSCVLAISLYEIMMKLFGQRAALMGCALLLLNINFYAESTFVMNDIMLGLFIFLSLYFYIRERFVLTALFLTLLFLTKESGLVICLPIGIDILWGRISKKAPPATTLKKGFSLLFALMCVAVFFIIQKHQNGWYLTPGHVSNINLDIKNTFSNLSRSFSLLLYYEQIYVFYGILLILSVIAAVKYRHFRYLAFFPPAIIVIAWLLTSNNNNPIFYFFTAFFILFFATFFIRPLKSYTTVQERFIKMSVAVCLAYLYFCCINFFEGRYLFPGLFLLTAVLLPIVLNHFISLMGQKVYVAVMVLIVALGLINFHIKFNEYELGMYDRMDLQQSLVDYFEKNNFYDKKIYCNAPLEQMHLENRLTGFLSSKKVFRYIVNTMDGDIQLAIFDNIDEPDKLIHQIEKDSSFFLLYQVKKGADSIEVYKRK